MTRKRSGMPATKDDMATRERVRSECVDAMISLARAAEHRAELSPSIAGAMLNRSDAVAFRAAADELRRLPIAPNDIDVPF